MALPSLRPVTGPTPRWLLVGDACQNACTFCTARKVRYASHVNDWAVEAAVFKRQGTPWVLVGGQEPTLTPRLGDLLRMLKKAGVAEVTLETNAIALDDTLRREVLRAGADSLHVLSYPADTDTAALGVAPDHAAAMAKHLTAAAQALPGKVRALVPLLAETVPHLAAHHAWLREQGARPVYVVIAGRDETPLSALEALPGPYWVQKGEQFLEQAHSVGGAGRP